MRGVPCHSRNTVDVNRGDITLDIQDAVKSSYELFFFKPLITGTIVRIYFMETLGTNKNLHPLVSREHKENNRWYYLKFVNSTVSLVRHTHHWTRCVHAWSRVGLLGGVEIM